RMARKRKIWHGDGVYKAGKLLDSNPSLGFLSLFFPKKNSFNGYSGENVGLMYTGRVRGVKFVVRTNSQIATALHQSWMHSPGHRANILNSKFKAIGIGVKQNKNGYYGTELFYG
ncbi:MAG: CAP domain-containing protein, partial [Candidatus Micrarchaeota archaeon]